MTVLKRSRLFEQIAEILEQRIRSQLSAPGDELPSERDLMKEFGVGRTAVREALFHLQRMGLVELRPGARARVATPTPAAVMS
ncbi:MAG: GntR family transcriptional regulator, partial [Aestuariivirga sp.]